MHGHRSSRPPQEGHRKEVKNSKKPPRSVNIQGKKKKKISIGISLVRCTREERAREPVNFLGRNSGTDLQGREGT